MISRYDIASFSSDTPVLPPAQYAPVEAVTAQRSENRLDCGSCTGSVGCAVWRAVTLRLLLDVSCGAWRQSDGSGRAPRGMTTERVAPCTRSMGAGRTAAFHVLAGATLSGERRRGIGAHASSWRALVAAGPRLSVAARTHGLTRGAPRRWRSNPLRQAKVAGGKRRELRQVLRNQAPMGVRFLLFLAVPSPARSLSTATAGGSYFLPGVGLRHALL